MINSIGNYPPKKIISKEPSINDDIKIVDYNSQNENSLSAINIPNKTLYFGEYNPEYIENEKFNIKLKARKKSCDSNISNVSEIFQKALNEHSYLTKNKNAELI